MIDTHCHLTDKPFQPQLEQVIQRATAAGVRHLITIGTDIADDEQCIALCRGRDSMRCAIGVHPNYSGEADKSQLPRLRQLQQDPAVVALGEMGLDYHYGTALKDRQIRFFEVQLHLAAEVRRPVVIHCREAVDDCLAVMGAFPTVQAVFHCFTGTAAEAAKILGAGYLLGFTGVVTFKKSDELREVVRRTPADRLLLETDAPYLSPEPMRKQKVNEPALLVHTAAVVATVKGMPLEELDEITTANAGRFFGWPS